MALKVGQTASSGGKKIQPYFDDDWVGICKWPIEWSVAEPARVLKIRSNKLGTFALLRGRGFTWWNVRDLRSH